MNKMTHQEIINKQQGFTLIEMLVVIAIMVLVVTGTINLLSILIKNRIKAQTLTQLEQEGNKIINIVGRTINSAAAITYPDPTAGPNTEPHCGMDSETSPITPTENLQDLTVEDVDGNQITLRCSNENEETGTKGSISLNTRPLLTNENITLSDCSITCYNSNSGKGAMVILSLELSMGKGKEKMSDIFSNTFVLRNYKK